ncbi:hypothetical protein ACP46_gp78 [Rhizobium phage RHEph06]|uniref:Uncharacterized protein n=2 Tax=Kleczkowskavirus RHEph4 TaxID=1921526 RepID=L7TJQ7_9CAUD|nr:hypothetical protein ACP46_gp78 [Rhizobium phage RHEph06]YP_009598519.1 hypothetical protein FDH25_gp77 [Rhizobium phage RHEph04]AGC35839.1 hypothetical protein RHEph05_gp072 [Rhizobium phage RHEph05]QIG68854.1 hypothetical protein EVB71_002 [Rhizobium phage RHph_Y55]QIG69485.1 hypothetical protein EVB80_002 [Rhizobium phage RHph_I36]QIG75359.1 hypothetical protein EVC17_002 [Rhizobium phage RHph_Y1_1]QIG75909.1 hypothetical protein EVC21_002 [Rhizobium phage RHph_Y2_17_2]QXV74871.1 hypot
MRISKVTRPDWVQPKTYKRYDFKSMQVGDLMVIAEKDQGCKNLKSFRALVWNRSRQLGYVLSCRQREDGAFEVYRSE